MRSAMSWRMWLVVVSSSLVSASSLLAQPVIAELQPRGAQQGKPFTMTLAGRNLGEGATIRRPTRRRAPPASTISRP